jgi:hypothetical protein
MLRAGSQSISFLLSCILFCKWCSALLVSFSPNYYRADLDEAVNKGVLAYLRKAAYLHASDGTARYEPCSECIPGATITISMSLEMLDTGSQVVRCKVASHKFNFKKRDSILPSDSPPVEWAIGAGYFKPQAPAHTTATWVYLAIDGSRTWPIFTEVSVVGNYAIEDQVMTLAASLRKEQALQPCKYPCLISFP